MSQREPLFSRLTPGGLRNYLDTLRGESVGGVLLVVAAVIALLWSNSPWRDAYTGLRDLELGPAALHLDLTVGQWASDGLLAIFFFVVGLELKREIVEGELRRLGTAIVPVVAAVGGMVVPALLFLAVNTTAEGGGPHGWAIPTATDIAFAVAVLGIAGKKLPTALRAFLLTLAVVDDLLAILVIAIGYSDGIALLWLLAAAAAVVLFWLLLRAGLTHPLLLIPLALVAWALLHTSGVHATIAGVALGLVVPIAHAERLEHRWRPLSAGFAVPVFALFAAGVAVAPAALAEAVADPVAQGIVLGLVVGKPLGITLTTWLVCRFRGVSLAPGLRWADVVAVGTLAGIGFTVSLLVAGLAYGEGSPHTEHATMGVLAASLLAALVGGALLVWRGRRHELRRAAQDASGIS
ncbi:Na+/H+ antiporter NhaA [Pseudactinotalea suaedae]|uniref:Na+/H+ antiporter NhaA n=1 Tax=Pseudactinotalea suaedae TaxID=1524924 RepID=UPI0012E2C00B|nr:Na+/H+ antiporter NhaA [Pseudactinotalea suaedae]